jgi:hypothetical protein
MDTGRRRYDKGTAEFFAERRGRADFAAFDRLMRRKGGEPPQADDEIA